MHAPNRLFLALVSTAALVLVGAGAALGTHSSGSAAELVALIGTPATHAVFVTTPVSSEWVSPDCSTVLVVDLTQPPHTPVAGTRTEPDAETDVELEPDAETDVELEPPAYEAWVPACVASMLAKPAPLRWLPQNAIKRWQIEHFENLEGFMADHADDPKAMPNTARVAVPSAFGHTGTIPPAAFKHLKVELREETVRRDVCMFPYDIQMIPADEIPRECFAPGCPSCTGEACDGTCTYPDPESCPDPCESCISDVITYRFRVTDTRTGTTVDGTRFVASAATLTQAEMVCPDKSPVEMALNQLAVHETETALIVFGSAMHGWMYNDTSIPVIAVLPKGSGSGVSTPGQAAGCASCQGGSAGGGANALGMLVGLMILLGLGRRGRTEAGQGRVD